MLTLPEVLQFLRDKKYILISKDKYILSKTFQDDVRKVKKGEFITMNVDVIPKVELSPPVVPAMSLNELKKFSFNGQTDWVFFFSKFIADAKVPAKLEDNRGNLYAANKYSEEGMKVFKKALESGVDYGTLVSSTMLYYKSNIRYKKAVGNYFTQGDWRSDYQALKEAALSGTNELQQHIKEEVKSNEHNNFRLG